MLADFVLGYYILSRLAYVIGVGCALTWQQRYRYFTRRVGVEAGFRQFRRVASMLMQNDAWSFVALCLVTRNTLPPAAHPAVPVLIGVLLAAVGIGTKLWAVRRLGPGAYYWHDFFVPERPVPLDPPGPYRYLKNPMYTFGYLQTYGLALFLGSLSGLAAAAFAQVAILTFNHWVEKPHFELLVSGVYRR